ncbi:MAG: hypothetical protein JRN52_02365 [Nitrososphaerota archaeon]|nr:hypothetical protein [Nitrososphaerota archaeon]
MVPATDDSVVHWMEKLHPVAYEDLLTNNGKLLAGISPPATDHNWRGRNMTNTSYTSQLT